MRNLLEIIEQGISFTHTVKRLKETLNIVVHPNGRITQKIHGELITVESDSFTPKNYCLTRLIEALKDDCTSVTFYFTKGSPSFNIHVEPDLPTGGTYIFSYLKPENKTQETREGIERYTWAKRDKFLSKLQKEKNIITNLGSFRDKYSVVIQDNHLKFLPDVPGDYQILATSDVKTCDLIENNPPSEHDKHVVTIQLQEDDKIYVTLFERIPNTNGCTSSEQSYTIQPDFLTRLFKEKVTIAGIEYEVNKETNPPTLIPTKGSLDNDVLEAVENLTPGDVIEVQVKPIQLAYVGKATDGERFMFFSEDSELGSNPIKYSISEINEVFKSIKLIDS